jgi:hypothetical protein
MVQVLKSAQDFEILGGTAVAQLTIAQPQPIFHLDYITALPT